MSEDLGVDQGTYYPSWKLRLIVRFEEFSNTAPVDAKAPKKMVHKLRGVKPSRGTLTVSRETTDAGVRRFVLAPSSGQAPAGPQKEDRSADDLTWSIGAIVPRSFSWKQSGLLSADEFKAVLKFSDFPFDPRAIRNVAVEFYLGCLSEEDYRRGVAGGAATTADPNQQGAPANVLPDSWVDANGRNRSNLRFQGWVDEFQVVQSDDEEPSVAIDCRDNTKVFIDQDAPPKLAISAAKPIDEALANYFACFPQFAGLGVEYRPGGVDVPSLGKALAKTAFQPELGPVSSKGGGAAQTFQKMSVWDYVVDACGAIGHSVFVEGTTVVVQRVRTITSSDLGARGGDPFLARSFNGMPLDVRTFVHGRNVQEYELSRRYAKDAPTNVECRCYSPRRKKTLVVRYPLDGQSIVTDANPGDGHEERKYLVWRVSGIEDEKTLRLIAQTVYEVVGRNEIAIRLKTMDMASFGGGNLDPDVLDMRPGDAFRLLVDRNGTSTTGEIEDALLVEESARQFLVAAGYSDGIAAAYARAYSNSGFQTAFRTKGLSAEGDEERGVSLTVEGVNYVEVRLDRSLPEAEEVTGAGTAGRKTSKVAQPKTS